ncbi:hypothetical protein EDD18DRAFT_86559 [Armillaria luteobubalina]|uniref:Uncharacterized protein n=1 Tax=Armillaria luteobubalina TaxID=153913 RepID=A0AA39UYJ8_9AGAR|nr:hypothetical protein EDD18DRAFT_86559 [Armillaria luteobubalina]
MGQRKRDRVAATFRRILDVALCYVILAVTVSAPHPLASFIQTTITSIMNNSTLPTSDAALRNLEKQIQKESKMEDSAVKHSLKTWRVQKRESRKRTRALTKLGKASQNAKKKSSQLLRHLTRRHISTTLQLPNLMTRRRT